MSIFFASIEILILAFALHLAIWRIKLPKRQPRAVFLIFMATLAVFFIFSLVAEPSALPSFIAQILPTQFIEYLYIACLYIPVTLSYTISYTAIEAESPSALIVLAIEQSKERGVTRKQFDSIITDELFVENRIRGLIQSQFVKTDGENFQISAEGKRFLNLFLFPRIFVFRMEKGG